MKIGSLIRRVNPHNLLRNKNKKRAIKPRAREMVTLVVATTTDPASIGPASALLAMPGWHPGPPLQVSLSLNQSLSLSLCVFFCTTYLCVLFRFRKLPISPFR